ncbi:MAG TPA: PhzF family phenazine biosynthesis protein [Allosphingosinicella sp.]|jgi:PhzF family phenazine biosynthesis protein
MPHYRLVQVDAFADRPFTGNPAAVVPLDAWLPDETLQAIAAENNLSETAFTIPAAGGEADYELRWFTPTTEVALCGHATLASGHVLIGDRAEVRFMTRKAGGLAVRRGENGALELDLPLTRVRPADAEALRPYTGDGPSLVDIITHDGASDAAASAQVFLSHEGAEATAILLLADESALRACVPDMRALRAVDLMVIVTAPGAPGRGYDVASRVFVPAWGVDEDPVTGSAHAALAPFWAERLGRATFSAYQASRRGGHVSVRVAGDRAVLGGRCVTVIEGTLFL